MKKGKNVTIYDRAKICYPENLIIGNNVIIDDFVFIVAKPWAKIGNYVHIASFVSITGGGIFIMGDYSGIATGSRILTGTDDISTLLGPTVPVQYRKPRRTYVEIGKHVLISANCVILPSVTIPDGVVIGANSLVLENAVLQPWTIYVGSPVQALKERPRERILELQAALERDLG